MDIRELVSQTHHTNRSLTSVQILRYRYVLQHPEGGIGAKRAAPSGFPNRAKSLPDPAHSSRNRLVEKEPSVYENDPIRDRI